MLAFKLQALYACSSSFILKDVSECCSVLLILGCTVTCWYSKKHCLPAFLYICLILKSSCYYTCKCTFGITPISTRGDKVTIQFEKDVYVFWQSWLLCWSATMSVAV